MTSFARNGALCLSFLLACLFVATPGIAILVRPVLIELTSTGGTSNGSIEVVNDRNRPVAVELKVNRLDLPERGKAVTIPDDGKDFLIFPAIAEIPAGGRQVFRIRYIGEPGLAQSKLFMFASAELPVAVDPNESRAQIQVLYSINSLVAVRPPKAESDIRVAGVERSKNDKGEPGLLVTFQNDGPAHGFVGNMALSLTDGGWTKKLEPDQSAKAFGLGLIPPNGRRTLFAPMPDVPPGGAIRAELKPASAT